MNQDVELSAPAPPPAAGLSRFEIPVAGAVSAALFAAFLALPLLGTLGVPLAAVPIVRMAHRRGVAAGALAGLIGAAIILGVGLATGGGMSAVAMALFAGAIVGMPAASVGFLRAGADPSRCYLGLCVAGAALIAGLAAVSAASPGRSLEAEVGATFDRVTPGVTESYRKSGADADTVARMKSTLETSRDIAQRYLWGLFGAMWVGGGALAFYGGAAAARPGGPADAARFDQLRVPAAAAGLFAASGAAFGLLEGEGRRIAGNVLIPLAALYFVAGLSIICHFFRRWFRFRLLRAGLYVLVSYVPLNVGVALLGLFDWYVDFRRRAGGGRTERS